MLHRNPHPGVLLSLRIPGEQIIMWTASDQAEALAAGWFLDEDDGAIQADSESNTFADPNEVSEYLCDLGTNEGPNQDRAIRAMIFTNHANMMAWFERREELRDDA